MENSIRLVGQDKIDEVKRHFKEKGDKGLLVELQGKELETWQQYAVEIGRKLSFPAMYQESEKEHVFEAYDDWITDLSWFEGVEEFAIIIYDYRLFLWREKGNVRQGTYGSYILDKNLVVRSFVDSVLPWWDGDVEKYCVGGKAKPFNVYLVD